MKKKTLIILADGFEEIEAVTPIDVLRRLNIDVTVAGLNDDMIKSTRGLVIKADKLLSAADNKYDAVVLPGGMPGAEHLASSSKVRSVVSETIRGGGIVAAICASPALVLGPMGVLDGKTATCFPGMETNFSAKVKFSRDKVVQDGNIITSRGPATAFLFAFKIAEKLVGKEMSDMVAAQMLCGA